MTRLNRVLISGAIALTATNASAHNLATEVAEPAIMSLLVIGLFGLGLARRRIRSGDRN